MIRMIATLLAYAVLSLLPVSVHAQSYPKQPINLLIPLAPGDATDVAGRTIGGGLSKLLKGPVVAIKKPGGGGTVGPDSAGKGPKKGYTILITKKPSPLYHPIP